MRQLATIAALLCVAGCDDAPESWTAADLDDEGCAPDQVWVAEAGECFALDSACDVPPGVEHFPTFDDCLARSERCVGSEDCAAGRLCDRVGCGDDALGRCVATPGACAAEVVGPEATLHSVCGCDEITYSSDCERVLAGAALAHRGACGT